NNTTCLVAALCSGTLSKNNSCPSLVLNPLLGPCNPNPCENDGSCEVITPTRRGDVFGEYICKCQLGFDGAHCQISCTSLLGMEGGGIVESQISASSVHYGIMGLQRWGPELARLNNHGIVNAWTSAAHDRNPWIEIDLQKTMRLTGIITQGASRMGSAEFIKAFKVSTSCLSGRFNIILDRREHHELTYNDSTKTNLFDPPIVAQYIRIIPVVCRKACTLRMELLGCELNGCSEPMGMKSRLISDGQVSASSSYRTWGIDTFTWYPQFARLDKQGKTNAWSAATNNRSEWIQIFPGNTDNNTHKRNLFEPPFYARYVRVLPWEWHERITLRMELLGCDD
uniref:Milk fat globule EGF and factor V/VIII domain containing a n=1 Tax=Myripristis murdjan TaxID=586833 RepID=A0A667YZP6_9TELE